MLTLIEYQELVSQYQRIIDVLVIILVLDNWIF